MEQVSAKSPVGARFRLTSEPKHSVPDIGDIFWPVGDSTLFRILRAQDKLGQLLAVDPMRAVQDGERCERPPAVADLFVTKRQLLKSFRCPRQPDGAKTYIFELFWSAVEASVRELALAEPPAEGIGIDDVEPVEDRERAERCPDCTEAHVSFSLALPEPPRACSP